MVRTLPTTATLARIEYGIEREAAAGQVAAKYRAADAAQTAEAGAPGHAAGSDIGPVEIRDQSVDQRLGTACSETYDGHDGQEHAEREACGQEHAATTGFAPKRSATLEPMRAPL
jgi:hypothetical protein